jgi:hypothetical protein
MIDAQDAQVASDAGRQLAALRWRRTRVDNLLTELSSRSSEFGDEQVERLVELVDEVHEKEAG